MMILPALKSKSDDYLASKQLSTLDKHVYNCLRAVSNKSFVKAQDFLDFIGERYTWIETEKALKRMADIGLIQTARLEKVEKECLVIYDLEEPTDVDIRVYNVLSYLNKNPYFRNTVVETLCSKFVVKRRGPIEKDMGIFFYGSRKHSRISEGSVISLFYKKGRKFRPEPIVDSFKELHALGIRKNEIAFLISKAMGNTKLMNHDQTRSDYRVLMDDFIKPAKNHIKCAIALFLESCILLAKRFDTPEKFFEKMEKNGEKVIGDNKVLKKKEREIVRNINLDARISCLIDHWNSKSLVKHWNYHAKTIKNAAKMMQNMINGEFTEGLGKVKYKDFRECIDKLDLMANDYSVAPTNPAHKEYLKKMSLEKFLYNDRTGESKFVELMKMETMVIHEPYNVEEFNRFIDFVEKKTFKSLYASQKNKLAKVMNLARDWMLKHKKIVPFGVTIQDICSAIIRHFTSRRVFINYELLNTKNFWKINILDILMAEGLVITYRSHGDDDGVRYGKRVYDPKRYEIPKDEY